MSNPSPLEQKYKLVFTVPKSSLEACKSAVFAKGAGAHPGGKYSLVCFESPGQEQFLPGAGANPTIGKPGTLEVVDVVRVEVLCVGIQVVQSAAAALRKAHPYEEPAFEVYKIEDI